MQDPDNLDCLHNSNFLAEVSAESMTNFMT